MESWFLRKRKFVQRKDLEAGITPKEDSEEVQKEPQDTKEPDIDFDAALKELTKNDYDESKE